MVAGELVCECITLFMYCDRPHSFRSIFIQSFRLTMDPLLISFITPLRLSECVFVDNIYFLSPHTKRSLCLCLTLVNLLTGRGKRIGWLLCQIVVACLYSSHACQVCDACSQSGTCLYQIFRKITKMSSR